MESQKHIHSKKRSGKKRAALFALSAIVSISASMTAVSGAVISAYAENDVLLANISERVDELLEKGSFVEGNALVTVYKGTDLSKYRNALTPVKNTVSSKARRLLKKGSNIMSLGVDSLENSAEEKNDVFSEKKDVEIVLLSDTGMTTKQLLTELLQDEQVLCAEPDYVVELAETNPEPNYAEIYGDATYAQWGFKNDGTFMNNEEQTLENFALNPTDWNNSEKTNATGVVAVLDSGIDYNNPDLKNIMVDNMEDYNEDGGKYGYAPCNEDVTDPMDDHYHGTHCAGIIAAEWNDYGVSGAANGCRLTAVKFLDSQGSGYTSDAVKCYQYLSKAMDSGLELVAINNSWGSTSEESASEVLNMCITEVGRKGAISIFAAGNDSSDCDVCYGSASAIAYNPYVVTVGASSPYGKPAYFTNYGERTIDIFSPGLGILSTVSDNADSYIYETDKSPLFSEDFSDKETDILFIGKENEDFIYSFDDNINFDGNSSLKFALSQCDASPEPESTEEHRMFSLGVLLDEESKDKISYVNFKLHSSFINAGIIPTIATLDEKGDTTVAAVDGYRLRGLWSDISINIPQVFENAELTFSPIPTGDSYLFMMMFEIIPLTDEPLSDEGMIYLDDFSIGENSTKFMYLNGTSMAAPGVTGCAAIVAFEQKNAGKELFGDEKSSLAIERANILKGRVRHYETLDENFCRQGGQLDMSITDVSEYTPVINSAEFNENTLTLNGAFFGESGKVAVNGSEVAADSWTDNEITVTLPEGTVSGRLNVDVTSVKGRTGKNVFLFEKSGDEKLYEKQIKVPEPKGYDDSLTSYYITQPTALDGKLYIPFKTNMTDGLTNNIYCYDIAEEKWSVTADLPVVCENPSLVTYNEEIYAYCTYTDEIDENLQYVAAIFRYIPETDEWEELEADNLVPNGAVANVNGILLLVGGTYYDSDNQEFPSLEKENIFKLEINGDEVTSTVLGTLSTPQSVSLLAVNKNDVYVYGVGEVALDKITVTESGVEVKDLSEKIPQACAGYSPASSFTAVKEGLVFAGLYMDSGDGTAADYDTYILKYDDETLVPYEKRICPDVISHPLAYAYDGYLYVFGLSRFNDNGMIGRATAIETNVLAGECRTKFLGAYITLRSEIGVNLRFNIKPSQAENTKIYLNNETEPITPVQLDKYTYEYIVEAAPKDVYRSVNHILIKNGEETVYDSDYSIKENYIDVILNDTDESEEKVLIRKLADSFDTYVRAAEIYFDDEKHFDETITSKINADFEVSKTVLESLSEFNVDEENGAVSYYGSSLILNDDVTLRHYLNITDYEAVKDCIFDGEGEKAELTFKDGKYCFDTKEILPEAYDNTTMLKYGENVIVGNYSVLSFIKLSAANDNKLGTICKAMCSYYDAAETYREYLSQE